MSRIEIRPVQTWSDKRRFLTFPWKIYRNDHLWVPPLLPQRAKTIDPKRGAFFQRGEAEFFIAWREGQPVGTICAGEDKVVNAESNRRECIFGFFEYFDDIRIAESLLQQITDWARQRNLDTLSGPFNLDREDSYGVLIEGREERGAARISVLCFSEGKAP